jgi:hypothetical protein
MGEGQHAHANQVYSKFPIKEKQKFPKIKIKNQKLMITCHSLTHTHTDSKWNKKHSNLFERTDHCNYHQENCMFFYYLY